MQTTFTDAQRADPAIAASEGVIRKCVHCGFCTATCPTYVLLGDELDSPRGRIYLIKDMLENAREPSAEVVKHIDRCLSCLSCMTTCPSGVNYMHLVDHARAYIAGTYKRLRRLQDLDIQFQLKRLSFSPAQEAIGQRARVARLDVMPAMVDQVHVVHARRAGRHAGQARQATVDVPDFRLARRAVALQHRLDEVDPPTWAVALVAQQHEGRAGGGAEAAMHALAQDILAARRLRIGELGQGEVGLHR